MTKKSFSMHPALLRSVIRHQSASVEKAVLEAVMNSIDAGASTVDIHLAMDSVRITDNGRGFQNEEEIEQFFATFGTPHAAGDATYGRFRMGRGQLFNLGKNVWRSNGFILTVDIGADDGTTNAEDLGFTIGRETKPTSGCSIKLSLYTPFTASTLMQIESEIARYVKYVEAKVLLNGRRIAKPLSSIKWNLETNEARFQFNRDGSRGIWCLVLCALAALGCLALDLAGRAGAWIDFLAVFLAALGFVIFTRAVTRHGEPLPLP